MLEVINIFRIIIKSNSGILAGVYMSLPGMATFAIIYNIIENKNQ